MTEAETRLNQYLSDHPPFYFEGLLDWDRGKSFWQKSYPIPCYQVSNVHLIQILRRRKEVRGLKKVDVVFSRGFLWHVRTKGIVKRFMALL